MGSQLFGKDYYIDFEKITELCEIKKSDETENLEINVFKYELIKMCLQRVLEEGMNGEEDVDPFMVNGQSMSFKLAYITLIKHEIIVEYDEE